MFTMLMNPNAVISVQHFDRTSAGSESEPLKAGSLEVRYGVDAAPIVIEAGDECYDFYLAHWRSEKERMIKEHEENLKNAEEPTESVGPVN